MRHLFFLRVGLAFVLFCLPLAAGCGGGSSFKTVPVKGKVTVDKEPVTSGMVTLVAQDPKAPKEVSSGEIGSNGEYTIKTAGKDGVPLGKYKVLVSPGGSAMMTKKGGEQPPPYNLKYGNPQTTTLEYEVVENPSAGQYDLKLKK